MTHRELVDIAYKWVLKRGSCGVAFKELNTSATNGEYPDVIGFGAWQHSVVVECKISRADFFCDKKKPFRKEPNLGMGKYRYFCCPEGLIKTEELPERWGLIYVSNNGKYRTVFNPFGKALDSNIFTAGIENNIQAEHSLMYSALRRLFIKGYVKHIYDKNYNRTTSPDELILLNSTSNPTQPHDPIPNS